ncbi:adenylate/guanylate cyclase domain-containing protein, partial [bacterium]|nr:adenylate/guanylate cyclase domain-containing protein [bacterium]
DGYLRRTAQLISYKGKFYPSLALVMYSKLTGIHRFVLTDENLWGISDDYTLKIPINFAFGSVVNLLHFYKTKDGVYSHEHYSAGDIIKSYRAIKNGEKPIISPEIFNNKIVFVGANAQAQALQDIQRTPVSEVYSGADIQAINFDNLINNDFYFRTNKLYNFILCVLIFFVVFVFVLKLSIPYALISGFSVGFIYFAFALLMYQNKVAIDVILPEVFVIVALVCAYSYKYFVEDLKKTKIQNAMGKYLSYDVMQKVVTNIDNVSLGGKREDITVLFADIRNFTSISETMDPNSTSMILNEYFTEMVPIIEGHRGILNKFMGDAILAIFGEPKKSDNHAYDAVLCASKMLSRVSYLQSKWLEEGKPKIEIGIGICSGEAFIGNIGSNERLEYTVIGDTVNTASRIENYNKVYRTNFLISESTYERVKDFVDAIVIRDVVIRGKAGRINLYEVIRLKNEREF